MSVRILCGDALAMLRTLESESVQVCVSSPPYFQLRDYGHAGQIGLESTPTAFIAALVAVFDEVKRVLRSDGVCFVNLGDSYAGSGKGPTGHNGIGDQEQRQGFVSAPEIRGAARHPKRDGEGSLGATSLRGYPGLKGKDLMLIPERFAIAMQDAGWWVRSQIAWCKLSAMPESVRDRPTSAWEPIWMFTKSRTYFWDQEAVRQPNVSAEDTRNRADYVPKRERNVGGRSDGYTIAAGPVGWNAGGANLRNWWALGPEPSRLEHYAGFPTELPRRCIKAASRPGDTVLDPFSGTFTTCLVAEQLGRDSIGIELNPKYVEIGRKRLLGDAPMLGTEVHVEAAQAEQLSLLEAVG